MTLEMFLLKRTYIGAVFPDNWVKGKIELTKKGRPINIKLERVSSVEEIIGMWSNALPIHNWFVSNCGSENYDSGIVLVPREKLAQLLNICKEIQERKVLPEDVLPVELDHDGEACYGDDYMWDIGDTINIIETILSEIKEDGSFHGDICYSAAYLPDEGIHDFGL